MNRAGLTIALIVAVIAGLAFGFYPQLDLAVSRQFFDAQHGNFGQPSALVEFLRDANTWLIAIAVAPAALALLVKLVSPRRRMLIPPRAAILLIGTLALGPGLTTNIILKDYWGRTRPYGVVEFSGTGQFVPWWDPRGGCRNNCSFIAGEPSGAFWMLAPASFAPAPWRPLAYAAAVTYGLGIGLLRLAFGAHFLSDVIFAGVITFFIIWIVHGLLYHWPRTRIDDETIDAEFERRLLRFADALGWLGRRVISEIAGPEAGDDADRNVKRRRRGWW